MATNFKQRNPNFPSHSEDNGVFIAEDEEKGRTRRRKGCGHPYRLRLNMATEVRDEPEQYTHNHYQPSQPDNPKHSKEVVTRTRKQGRHPYRRSSRADYEPEYNEGNKDVQYRHENQRHVQQFTDELEYQMPKLSDNQQQDPFANSDCHYNTEKYGNYNTHHEPNRNTKNLSPYNQRSRKSHHRQNEMRDYNSFPSQGGDYREAHQKQQSSHGNLRNPQYGQRNHSRQDSHGNHYASQERYSPEASYAGNGNVDRSNEGAKVVYKKRRTRGIFTRQHPNDSE